MKATEAKLLDLLRKASQFRIPIYQRTYSWTEKQCRQLWDDIVRAGTDDGIVVHFVGSIVYIEAGLSQVTHQIPLLVIDGQQRLTTVTLFLAALAEAIGDGEPMDGFSARKIRNWYLLNPEETDERHYKLILSQNDKDTLTAIVGRKELPKEPSRRVVENFELFRKLIRDYGDLAPLCRGLAKLVVVDLALSREHDNPQLIFESMNSTGLDLSQADLIRNFVLMGLEPKLQTRLYQDYWRPMEVDFGQEAYGTHFDAFMRHYLTVKTGDIPNIRNVYDAFKVYARAPKTAEAGVEALVKDIRDFARYYCAMALWAEKDPALKEAFSDLRELKVDVAYPLLLELYADYDAGMLTAPELVRAVRLLEAYVFRRAVCSIPTNSMNKTFATFTKALKKDRYLESIEAHFLALPSYRRFPRDEEFVRELKTRDLYRSRRASYLLRKLENHGRKEKVAIGEYTVEHILPQNPDLSDAWKASLGPEYDVIQERWLHTLGNLTLTGYNSEYSDRPFAEKRDMEGGFKDSPLKLNEGLGQLADWNEETIIARAERLAKMALDVWAAPELDLGTLAAYRPSAAPSAGYSIHDHHHLVSGAMAELFERLRKEVLALDPCVSEEFRKLYVAYKAETNFVDVIPQAKRLRLMLNMAFPDIQDPKGWCRDVTDVGRWGNGDVEVDISTLEQLPYVMSLVRQSFERQMGGDGDA